MVHTKTVYIIDVFLRSLHNIDVPFGGKVMIFAGDLRQLSVVTRPEDQIPFNASIFGQSMYYKESRVLALTENLRARGETEYTNFISAIGAGMNIKVGPFDSVVRIPECYLEDDLVGSVYGNIVGIGGYYK